MLLSGTYQGKGSIFLYESKDLDRWEMKSVFYQSSEFSLIECPNIMKFGELYLLLYSPLSAVRYAVGKIDQEYHFTAIKEGVFDYSIGKKGFYAPNTYLNLPDHRYVTFGCLFEGDRLMSKQERGWAGIQSLPREVSLENGEVKVQPVQECLKLRKKLITQGKETVTFQSASFEAVIELSADAQGSLAVELLCSADRIERTLLTISPKEGKIILDRSESTLYEDVTKETIEADGIKAPENGKTYRIRVFADHSAIEIFMDRQLTISARVFPKGDGCFNEVRFPYGAEGSNVKVYEMGL